MPCLTITTNAPLSAETESALAAAASKTLAAELGKPEAYVMVAVQSLRTLHFAGSNEPAAFLDVKSIGLPGNLRHAASALTSLLEQHTHISADRVFITFTDVPAARWAHAGSTFA